MISVLMRKTRTLMRDPRVAIASQFVRGNKQRARDYLVREGVEAFLRAGREEEIAPHPVDLWRLHRIVRERRPRAILEFGLGFSTIAMAHALMRNAADGATGHLWSVDTSAQWIANTREKIGPELAPFVTLSHSRAVIAEAEGELCHVYENLPDVNPDLLLLDGPTPVDVHGEIRGLSFNGPAARSPIAADPLLLESTLPDGFLMLVDGRISNMRFLRRHLKRRYRFRWNRVYRYSTFELLE